MATIVRCVCRSFPAKINHLFQKQLFKKILPAANVYSSNLLNAIKGLEVRMPSLSPTMTEGTIVRWLKKEGDTVSPGDVLCEIQTDKAIVGFEVDEEGILAKILVPDNSKDVKIGTIIGMMVEPDEDWKDVQLPESVSHASTISPGVSGEEAPAGTHGVEIKMPSLSPTMTEGTIVKWLMKEGDSFKPGDALCEIQTDKAVVAFEVEEEGILAKILVPENTKDVKLGTVIAIMVEEGEEWRNVSVPKSPVAAAVAESVPVNVEKSTVQVSAIISDELPKLCGPSVRNLLQNYGIKYSVVTPTGPHDNLLKGDVLKYINTNNLKPKPHIPQEPISAVPDVTFIESQEYIDIPHTSMRQVIARRLTESKTTIPHAYMSIDCNTFEVSKLRNQLKDSGIKVSVNDFIIKCVAEALVKVPELNVVCFNDKAKRMDTIDVSVAVATEKGLITPIVKQANTLGVQQISESVKLLAFKAKEGRLKPDEYQGGSFSISNLGMFGISEFSAVINPPQGAILAIGTSRMILQEKGGLTSKMTVTLSFDGRIVDENDAARFLSSFREHIENPLALIAGIPVKKPEFQNTF